MCTEVHKHQDIETGGNLFGLWTTSGSAVIHVAPGPGEKCRRTTTSFHQDIEYMHRVGRFVNDNYMLCHIGEWHSHHSLSLNRPSDGDERTVRRNFPEGVTKFLVIIANIKNRDTIKLSPYFFIDGGRRYEKAEVEVLDSEGPFSNDAKIMEQIQLGAEGGKRGDKSDQNVPKTRTIQSQSVSLGTPSGSTSGGGGEPMDVEDNDTLPPNHYRNDESVTSGSTTSKPRPVIPARIQADQENNSSDDDKTPSAREVVLKKVHDQLKYWFGTQSESAFNFESSQDYPGAIEISFKHHYHYWMVCFPADFPTSPAKIFRSIEKVSLHSKKCLPNIVEPLNNEVNILLTMKNVCRWCKICKNFTKESLSQPDFSSHSMGKLAAPPNKLVSDIETAFPDVTQLNVSQPSDTGQTTITFMHHNKYWIIDLPAQFPDVPASVYYTFYLGGFQRRDVILRDDDWNRSQELNTSKLIVKAIDCNCLCPKCGDM